jgi:glycosyltransferase involved in cell wall biosynthesis
MLVALAGSFPQDDDVLEFEGRLRTSTPGQSLMAALRASARLAANSRFATREMRVVNRSVLVDVDFTAQNGLNTGVQRVVRQTAGRWHRTTDAEFVVWTGDGGVMRALTDIEMNRLTSWTSRMRFEMPDSDDSAVDNILVPWDCTVVLPEVSQDRVIAAMRGLSQFSGNKVVVVGHDAIPVLSPEDVLPEESERFALFLSVVKYATLVVGVSESAATEFRGFASAVQAQGLAGPRVDALRLPEHRVESVEAGQVAIRRRQPDVALVLNVGSQEPRKNQTSILVAAETLWAIGLRFELSFIGAGSPPLSSPFDELADALRRKGRPISIFRQASDAQLSQAYEDAAFTVFPSYHEGFGLPVAESLAHGTPVITSKFGSVAEIAQGGGCICIDPRDPDALADAMRELLTKSSRLVALRDEIAHRPSRTWDDYAAELWTLVERVHRR